MKIESVTPIAVTLRLQREPMSYCFVRVEMDTGEVGYGEACDSYGCSYASVLATLVDDVYAPLLVGRELVAVEQLVDSLRLSTRRRLGDGWIAAQARSAVEIALWDVLGQHLSQSVSSIIGRVRDDVPVYVSGTFLEEGDAAWHADLLQPLFDRGVRAAKLRLGPNWSEEMGILEELRRMIDPGIELMVDGSETFTVPTATRITRRMAAIDIAWFEEPIPQGNHAGLVELGRHAAVPIAYGEHLYGLDEAVAAMGAAEMSVLQPDAAVCGGIGEARKMAQAAKPFGIRVALHQCAGPIAMAANLHTAATVASISAVEYGVFSIPAHAALSGSDVFSLDWIVGGRMRLPDTPGLGVSLDEAFAAEHPYSPPGGRVVGSVGGRADRFVGHI
ncbi:MAG: mandelate racemase/muconate lactonizing enzyme family protein [Ilumatobacteraceae bacterium]